jgi:hypothetical protein
VVQYLLQGAEMGHMKNKKPKKKGIKFRGETLTRQKWAERLGLTYEGFSVRLHRWGVKDARTFSRNQYGDRKRKKGDKITYQGESRTPTEWAEHLGIKYPAFMQRLHRLGEENYRVFKANNVDESDN